MFLSPPSCLRSLWNRPRYVRGSPLCANESKQEATMKWRNLRIMDANETGYVWTNVVFWSILARIFINHSQEVKIQWTLCAESQLRTERRFVSRGDFINSVGCSDTDTGIESYADTADFRRVPKPRVSKVRPESQMWPSDWALLALRLLAK